MLQDAIDARIFSKFKILWKKTDRGLVLIEYHVTNSALIFSCQELFYRTGPHIDLQ